MTFEYRTALQASVNVAVAIIARFCDAEQSQFSTHHIRGSNVAV